MSSEVAYTEFVFRVYPDGRKQRITRVYTPGVGGRPQLLQEPPAGEIAQAALSAVQIVTEEMNRPPRDKRRRVRI